jgi:hypothetical protein
MQATQGNAWDRLTADLAALAGKDHRKRPADSFVLADEHTHAASPPCWPRRLRQVYSHDTRELIALERAIGAEARATHVRSSRTFGTAALAKRYYVPLETMRAVLERA